MKDNFCFYVFIVMLFSRGSFACFQENFVNKSVSTGIAFYLECCCTEPGHNMKDLHWVDPFNKIVGPPDTDSNVYTDAEGDCLFLYIQSSSKSMSGQYRCITTINSVQFSQTHNLDVFDPLYFYDTPVNQSVLIHSNDSLIKCQARGANSPLIRWYRGKDGQIEISNDTVKYQFMPEGLIIKNINYDDYGIYKCSASVLSTGEEVEVDIDVQVMTIPKITQLTAYPEAVVTATESLLIECEADGLPKPEFEWRKIPELSLEEMEVLNWTQRKHQLHFVNIQPEAAGTYECIVHNYAGSDKKQINIVVQIPPEIIDFKNITALEGTELAFYCNATGLPLPNVTITYEGKSFEEERDTEYDEIIPNFSILKVNRSNEGIYVCNASSYVHTAVEYMYLSVLHQPYFDKTSEVIWSWDGVTVNISCAHKSNPSSNITWRYTTGNYSTIDKQEYDNIVLDYESSLEHSFTFSNQFAPFGEHECRARNKYGEAVKVYQIKQGFPPSSVTNATTIHETATSATFNIEKPSDYEGPDVIGYVAEYDEANNYNITNIHRSRTWASGIPFKLERLRPNTTYYIRFAAMNLVGTGEWSDTLEFDTLDKSAPEPPIWEVNALQISLNNVLKWKVPENNGVPIDYYAFRYCPMDEELDESFCKEQRIAPPSTELEVVDLQHNTTYYFELIAHNSEGNSTSANISLTIPAAITMEPTPLLSAGVLIGISIAVVLLCLLLLDLLLLFWRKQGIMASCCYKKNNKRKQNPLNSRDKKGLLKDNGESGTGDTLTRPNNRHKEYEYNKTTGIITGKHSSV